MEQNAKSSGEFQPKKMRVLSGGKVIKYHFRILQTPSQSNYFGLTAMNIPGNRPRGADYLSRFDPVERGQVR